MPDDVEIFKAFLKRMRERKNPVIRPLSFKLSENDEVRTSFFGWRKKNGLFTGLTYFKDSDNFSFEFIVKLGDEYNTISKTLSPDEKQLLPVAIEELMKTAADKGVKISIKDLKDDW